jgi:DNA-binding transcriptional LysR family regulator
MAENGLGIAYLPEFVGEEGTELVRVMPQVRIDSGYIWMLHHDELRHVARVRAFVEFMIEALRSDSRLNRE